MGDRRGDDKACINQLDKILRENEDMDYVNDDEKMQREMSLAELSKRHSKLDRANEELQEELEE